jgi:hypothetical protein
LEDLWDQPLVKAQLIGLRSHMDELIYRTKMPFKVKVI